MNRTSMVLVVAIFAACCGIRLSAEEPQEPETRIELQEVPIVSRFSRELLVDLSQQVIEMTVPVQTCVEGKPLSGEASGKGVTQIKLNASDDRAEFVISVPGSAVGKLRSDVGPAVVMLTSRAQFTAHKLVHFDGLSFRADPATASTRNCTTVDRICAKRKGPIGLFVQRIGRRIANDTISEVNALAEEYTEKILVDEFDDTAVNLVSELNRSNRFNEVVTKHFPETKTWKYRLATRPHFILAGLGPDSAKIPTLLTDEEDRPEAHMELWLRLTPGQAAMLELIGELDLAYDLLREFLPDADAEELADDVKIDRQDPWTVIKVGLRKTDPQKTSATVPTRDDVTASVIASR